MSDIKAIPEALRNSRLLILKPGSKQPAGKHATMEHGAPWDASADAFLARGTERLGIFMAGRYVVLDADLKQDWEDDGSGNQVTVVTRTGNDDVARLMAEAGLTELPPTVKIRTQGGGTHWYFEQNPECRVTQKRIGYLDVRAAPNAYCAIGQGYQLLTDAPRLAVLPLALARVIMSTHGTPAQTNGEPSQNGAALTAYGDKDSAFNNWLTQLKGSLVKGGCTNDEANEAVWRVNEVSRDPITREKFDETVGRDKGWASGEKLTLSEIEWAREQTGITEDDEDSPYLDIGTVKRLVTTERYRKQQQINKAIAQLQNLKIMSGADAADVEPKPWLIDEILPQGPGTGAIIGPKGSYKTTITLLMASAVTRGEHFLNRRATQGTVVFVAGEASDDTRRMLPKIPGHEEFIYTEGAFMLLPETAPYFANLIAGYLHGRPEPSLIIMDALSRFHAGDEDKAKEMLEVWNGADLIAQEFGCFVYLIGHTGHSGEHIRGTSAWGQALHTEIYTDGAMMKFNKQRGIRELPDMYFTLRHDGPWFTISEGTDLAIASTRVHAMISPDRTVQYSKCCKALKMIDGCTATEARAAISTTLSVSRQEANDIFMAMIQQEYLTREKGGGRSPDRIFVTERY